MVNAPLSFLISDQNELDDLINSALYEIKEIYGITQDIVEIKAEKKNHRVSPDVQTCSVISAYVTALARIT